MSKAKVTYITYNSGQEAKHLHLGNLVHDFQNPNSLDPYIESLYSDISEPAPEWARSLQLENFALTLGIDTRGPDPEDEDNEEGGTALRWRIAAAAKTTKLEIEDPEEFFDTNTLSNPAAKKWLSARLSAALSLPAEKRAKVEIWMLTGLVLMTHATWTSLSSRDHSFTAGLPAPFNPGGVSAIRKLSVSEDVKPVFGVVVSDAPKEVSGAVIHETGKYPGTRGWAAQWQKVEFEVVAAEKWKGGVVNQLMLSGPSEASSKIAIVKLSEEYAEREGEEDEDDEEDEFWDAFLEKADQLA